MTQLVPAILPKSRPSRAGAPSIAKRLAAARAIIC